MTRLALDFDGTMFQGEAEADMTDPASVLEETEPNEAALAFAAVLSHRMAEVHIVTGRTTDLEDVTREQIARAWLPWVDELHMQPAPWDGLGAMRGWKADVLEEIEADLYIGDRVDDLHAASQAGVRFLPASTFHLLAGAVPDVEVARADTLRTLL